MTTINDGNVPEVPSTGEAALPPKPKQTAPQIKSDLTFAIKGDGNQYLEVMLRPGQSVTGEIGALMYYEAGISMKLRTAAPTQQKTGFFEKIKSFGKAVASGNTLFMMYFTNHSQQNLVVAFSMPYYGNVVAINLEDVGGKIICQNDSLVCASADVRLRSALPKDLGGNFFTSSIKMQIVEGKGTLMLFSGGTAVRKKIIQGNSLHATTGSVLALLPGISLKVKTIPRVGLTGQGHMMTEISGNGIAWIQSMPYKRIKDNYIAQVGDFYGIKKKKSNPIWGK